MSSASEPTRNLLRWREGDQSALEALIPLVYDEMRQMAVSFIRHERPGHTLQPTALAHETYLRMIDQHVVSWQNRAHFMGVAAQAMRRILADHARRRGAAKRGGGATHVSIEDGELAPGDGEVDVQELDTALEDLARLDPRQARVVELRFFGGLSIEESAEVLGVSPSTVKRDWLLARAWLFRELRGRGA
jgi:RNA polymerase sigma factor (TIGR02999 family)